MTTVRLAGFATRALALLLDFAVLALITIAAGIGVTLVANVAGLDIKGGDPVLAAVAGVWWALLDAVYFATFWSLTGQTPGMRFMGLRVVDRGGGGVGRMQAVVRLAGMVLAAIPLGAGYLLILVDDRRQGLQDHLARTLVVHDPGTREASPAATTVAGVPREAVEAIDGDRPGAPATPPLGPDVVGR